MTCVLLFFIKYALVLLILKHFANVKIADISVVRCRHTCDNFVQWLLKKILSEKSVQKFPKSCTKSVQNIKGKMILYAYI